MPHLPANATDPLEVLVPFMPRLFADAAFRTAYLDSEAMKALFDDLDLDDLPPFGGRTGLAIPYGAGR